MLPTLTLPLVPAQLAAVASFFLANPSVAQVYGLAPADAEPQAAATCSDPLTQRYHLLPEPTPGLNYDDRLPLRLGCSSDKAYEYVNTPPSHGGLRCKRLGKRIVVTEQAVREFLGDIKAAA
jgi:hypothetical protein